MAQSRSAVVILMSLDPMHPGWQLREIAQDKCQISSCLMSLPSVPERITSQEGCDAMQGCQE